MKKKWASVTPEKREEWVHNMLNSHENSGQGFIDYYKKSRPERVKKVIELMTKPVEDVRPNQRYAGRRDKRIRRGIDKERVLKGNPRLDGKEWLPRGTCTMIAAHHEMLKHDDQRLTTEFMEEMCGVDCKCKIKKGEQV
jgi:hypothetical protein